jgi:coenzyme F420-reducing hydrogenase delta subunit
MVPRADGRAELVARIDADRCVSCGICAGSCAPMGVGPPGRTGRDQLLAVGNLITEGAVRDRVVAFACHHGAGTVASALEARGVTVVPVECVGNLHTSAVEFVVRAGARCAVVFACPPRDCWNREGPRWLGERIHHGREAELKERVDRRRVRIVELAAHDAERAVAVLDDLDRVLARIEQPEAETAVELDTECEVPVEAEQSQ